MRSKLHDTFIWIVIRPGPDVVMFLAVGRVPAPPGPQRHILM